MTSTADNQTHTDVRSRRHQVPAVGFVRRCRALVAIGYPIGAQAAALGISPRCLQRLAGQPRVSYRLWAAMAVLYAGWSTKDLAGPSSRARQIARQRNWPAPIAWDDVDIDDPSARPWRCPPRDTQLVDLVAVSRALNGDRSVALTRAECRTAYELAAARGMTGHQVADALGIRVETAGRGLNRARARARSETTALSAATFGDLPWITSLAGAEAREVSRYATC